MEERQPIDIRDLPVIENPMEDLTLIGVDGNGMIAGRVLASKLKELPDPSELEDGTIIIVRNGQWTTELMP